MVTDISERNVQGNLPAASSQGSTLPGWLHALFCALLLAVLVGISHPIAEMGIVDDWSYAYSANVLAKTGHVVYNGWGAMPLTWMLYWGALFIRLFGFSFLVLRISMLVLAMITVAVMHRFFRRCGLSEGISTLGTLSVMLSPFFFSVVFLFMSDIPGLLALVLCFYALVRAVQAQTDNGAVVWLAMAAIANLLVGSVRQLSLLGVLLMVPCAMWLLRKRRHLIAVMIPLWLVCALAVLGITKWFDAQLYSVHEALIPVPLSYKLIGKSLRPILSTVLYLPAISVLFLTALRWKQKSVRAVFAFSVVILAALFPRMSHLPLESPVLMPFTQQSFGTYGLHAVASLRGATPILLTMPERALLTIVAVILAIAVGMYFLTSRSAPPQQDDTLPNSPSWRELSVLFLPFLLAYWAMYATRATPWDRYLAPVVVVVTMMVLRLFQQRLAMRSARLVMAILLVLVAATDVAATHDLFAIADARLRAAKEIEDTGVPRNHVSAGFEYDGWTEIEATGYVKDPRLKLKPGQLAYRELDERTNRCVGWFMGRSPSLTPEYVVSFAGNTCLAPSQFPAVHFRTWLRPREWTLEIGKFN